MLLLGLAPALLVILLVPPWVGLEELAALSFRAIAYALVALATGMYSFTHYHNLGPICQDWHEARRGGWYRWMKAELRDGFSMPDGLVPAIFASSRIAIFGFAGMLLSLYLGSFQDLLRLLPGLIGVAASMWLYRRARLQFGTAYYHSNAFFREVFAGGRLLQQKARDFPYAATYWVPSRWRPSVWMTLTQLDRRLPLGRMMTLAHAILWILFFRDVDALLVGSYLATLIVAQKATIGLCMQPTMRPRRFAHQFSSRFDNAMLHGFVNFRWTFPMLFSLGLIAFFDASFTLPQALMWTGADALLSFAFAFAFSLRASRHYYRQYA